ncbi:MAG: hypothetical protein EOP56_03900 [Sphingobacteriales bacterium]|nr:MAG: hypothetical protein EOP56_03900 [Sphingobacteriales bacterium]
MPDKKTRVDWVFLLFLILVTNQAVFSVKLLGIALVYLLRFNLNFGFSEGRLPKFYQYLIYSSVFTFLIITREFSPNYIIAYLVGLAFLFFSLLTSHQVKLSVERYGFEGTYKTIKLFTLLHFLACMYQLGRMMLLTGKANPYDNTLPFPYGMSAGDNIFGLFMENSYYNIMVSSLLAVFFLFQRNLFYTLLATSCLILVFGNFGTIVFAAILSGLFVSGLFLSLVSTGWIKRYLVPGNFYWIIPFIFGFIAVLYVNVSPSNYDYVVTKVKDKVFRIKKDDKNNYAALIENQAPKPEAYDLATDNELPEPVLTGNVATGIAADFTSTNDAKKELTKAYIQSLAGKNLSVFETIAYLKSSPQAFLFGAGVARFSSVAATKVSGLDSSRLFSVIPNYRSDLYEQNHYLLVTTRETIGDDALKSTANWPDSLYNQLLGEYGVIGFGLFVFFYIGYFLSRYKKLTYGIWLILLLVPFAHLNYTFDTLCVIPFFELLLFADIKRNEQTTAENVQ